MSTPSTSESVSSFAFRSAFQNKYHITYAKNPTPPAKPTIFKRHFELDLTEL